MIFEITPLECINCDAKLEGLNAVYGERKPKRGDLTICSFCGGIMGLEFDADEEVSGVRLPTMMELVECKRWNPWMLEMSEALMSKRKAP